MRRGVESCRCLAAVTTTGSSVRPVLEAEQTQRLETTIKELFEASQRRSGSPKITRELTKRGWRVSKNRVPRRMRLPGLRSIVRRRFRVTTNSKQASVSGGTGSVAAQLHRAAAQSSVGERYTYLRVGCGWLYLAVFIDLYSRPVVGWALSSSLDPTLVLTARPRAVALRRPPRGLIIHSDRGVQYACSSFVEGVSQRGFVQSMSRKGDCWDNAVAESFFHLLKTEMTYHCRWLNYQAAYRSLFEYIEIFYNRERSHSTLYYVSPDQFEQHISTIAA